MSNKTGGRAFTCDSIVERYEVGHLHGFEVSSGGMTLRDYFAAKALIVAARGADGEPEGAYFETVDGIASRAYLLADAMLRAREAS